MNLFRGYVKTDGKKSLEKFKDVPDDKLHTLDEAKQFNSYAGILSSDVIMIDVDDIDQSELLMDIIYDKKIKCISYMTTRGRHFYFKNTRVKKCATNTMLSCGIVSDIKVGLTNSYDALKVNGKERECDYNTGLSDLPEWLIPVGKLIDFNKMKAGDGRNSQLYKYILRLNSKSISKDNARECINIINDYIFKDKLSKSEIETITRDEAFPENIFYDNKTFLFDSLARYLVNNNHVVLMHDRLHQYVNGVYEAGERGIEKSIHDILPRLRASDRSETIKCLHLIAPIVKPSDARYIALRNGIYDINTDKLLPFSPEFIIPNKIDWNYNKDSYNKSLDNMFNKLACDDKSIRKLLEEVAGYTMYRRNELSKFFIFVGEKHNGKSTYISVLEKLISEKNCSALDLNELGDRFKIAMVDGKLANFGDDISDEFQRGALVALLKKMVSGNAITGEFKGKDAFDFKPYVKLVFSANDVPHIKDRSGAVLRRLILVPFNASFTPSDADFDPYILDKLTTESAMEYLLLLSLKGLKSVLHNKDFSYSDQSADMIEEYSIENDPILSFLDEYDGELIGVSTKDLYQSYHGFCIDNGIKLPLTHATFVKNMCRTKKLTIKRKMLNGKNFRIFS